MVKGLISFIVPVYNAEKTLEDCVESILDQGLEAEAFEIILINDGSTDGSEKICLQLSAYYPCIKVLSQMNKGVSEARNRGIQNAHGLYLCFVDADDRLISQGLASILPFCNSNVDVVRFWCELIYPGSKGITRETNAEAFEVQGREYLKRFGLETFCWNYLYKRSFLEKNNLLFTPRIIGEDFSFMFDVLMSNPRMICVPKRVYRYQINEGSISTTRNPEHSRRWVNDLSGTMTRIHAALTPIRKDDPQLFQKCQDSLDAKMLSLFSRMLSANYSIKEFCAILNSFQREGLIPIQSKLQGRWDRISRLALNSLTSIPILYPIYRTLYTKWFLPRIYPKLDRNGA